ncbi:MAG: glycosyl hydrolase [Kiritimatiellae bacterium]|nr:glycosyl hydrolase [Kiritimatiellia bacterium]
MRVPWVGLAVGWAAGVLTGGTIRADNDLQAGFAQPPASARPHTWWHWMNGHISREGITADLQAMAAVGVGGAQIFNVDCGIPPGPVKFMSPEWLGLFRHALEEAERLGLEICVHNCAGWSSSGGPWVKPEHAMQVLTWSETRVRGGDTFRGRLPRPRATWDTYRDIAVLAFPLPAAERDRFEEAGATVVAVAPNVQGARVLDGDPDTAVQLPRPAKEGATELTIALQRPFVVRTVELAMNTGRRAERVELLAGDATNALRRVSEFTVPPQLRRPTPHAVGIPTVTARVFRLLFRTPPAERTPATIDLGEVRLSGGRMIENWVQKAGFLRGGAAVPAEGPKEEGVTISRARIVDLSDRMKPDGFLEWTAPADDPEWILARYGFTPTGKNNHPAPAEGTGPEVDKMSRQAADAFWEGGLRPLVEAAGGLVGRSWRHLLIDSYEVGSQNWTPRFREEFRARRGYDLLPFLPAMTGRIVDDLATSERFLWDLRRTIADLFHENYFGYFAELCRRHNLQLSIEPYGNGIFDEVAAGSHAEIPMGEFWVHGGASSSAKLAASIAHVYGRRYVGAESFTARWEDGRWLNHPAQLKALGDLIWCQGVNRFIFHRYAHQPWLDVAPGMTMGPWGFHFERTVTWWEPGAEWLRYLARGQWMLQEGLHVADVLAWSGESAPAAASAPADLPPGYDWDAADTATVIQRLQVEGGDLVAPHGSRWRVLVLPRQPVMTLATARRLTELVAAGARICGPAPERSPSLAEGAEADAELRKLVRAHWSGEPPDQSQRKIWARPLSEVLAAYQIEPDVLFPSEVPGARPRVAWIHRRNRSGEWYLVSNQSGRHMILPVSFRVSGRQPELWDAERGRIALAPLWRMENGRTVVTLDLGVDDSVFVVFRSPATSPPLREVRINGRGWVEAAEREVGPLRVLRALYTDPDDHRRSRDLAGRLNERIQRNRLVVRVDNTLGGDPAPFTPKVLIVDFVSGDRTGSVTVAENSWLELPPPQQTVVPASLPPPVLEATAQGVQLSSWETARVEWVAGNGRSGSARLVPPPPVPVDGPWTVKFPPHRGAPAQIELKELISWTDHPEPGVRFFSGSAMYATVFHWRDEIPRGGRRALLDLGDVRVIAEPVLNGRPLGVLWRAPFRADITEALRKGENQLEVRVTNLWPNRLIGDEHLPEDCDWPVHGPLKQLPEWFVKRLPRPSGRIAFTTWRHWTRNDPLIPSGLLGPVRIWRGLVCELAPPADTAAHGSAD